jgi:intraflagellar transport protein 122
VTEADWRLLAMEALRALELQIAQKSFTRIKDLKYIQLI